LRTWLIDTGPLVALISKDDHQHAWAVEQSKEAPPTVLTCDAVISESVFLLKRLRHAVDDLFAFVETGFLRSDFDFQAEARHVRDLMRRYADQPMGFADACLVRMAELHDDASVWTVDADFRRYRKHRRRTLSLVIPG
jgi:predicted nucleic acid-binding protein